MNATLKLSVSFNNQQLELLQRHAGADGFGADLPEVIEAIFRLFYRSVAREPTRVSSPPAAQEYQLSPVTYGALRYEEVLQPVTGRAIPVSRGEILRISQVESGGQCVDFNAFNLSDYKEHMSVGRTRSYSGIFPRRGDCLYSNSPRDRAMFAIIEMADSCRAETVGARCHAAQFERFFGLLHHTNCQDTLAEAIREYALTPDDVHDSFNMWMNTVIDNQGRIIMQPNKGNRGDAIDLLSMFDTLCVPVVCGSGDIVVTSNFRFKPIRIQVFSASESSMALALELDETLNKFRNQRTPETFRISQIRSERKLVPDPNYQADYLNYPLRHHEVAIQLTPGDHEAIEHMRRLQVVPGDDDDEIVRSAVMKWCLQIELEGAEHAHFIAPSFPGAGPSP
jgi:uncharacterized protein YcgI (DUF1989 family)